PPGTSPAPCRYRPIASIGSTNCWATYLRTWKSPPTAGARIACMPTTPSADSQPGDAGPCAWKTASPSGVCRVDPSRVRNERGPGQPDDDVQRDHGPRTNEQATAPSAAPCTVVGVRSRVTEWPTERTHLVGACEGGAVRQRPRESGALGTPRHAPGVTDDHEHVVEAVAVVVVDEGQVLAPYAHHRHALQFDRGRIDLGGVDPGIAEDHDGNRAD